jgi:hypothetical protein
MNFPREVQEDVRWVTVTMVFGLICLSGWIGLFVLDPNDYWVGLFVATAIACAPIGIGYGLGRVDGAKEERRHHYGPRHREP